ncbi:hypothetical protein [Chitinophaga cymbidii]|uniref:Uncharacterized protein n=1 Tax=Chitinophaga cymbidii TaxID=1096750 RepID=A0A512RP81_9BACT|nr:hypothetical protein [Chitinophaga cymbidii]GEP97499.1 hypothetical protein CCY01nite_37590 [Chitinophaga cymbidii]
MKGTRWLRRSVLAHALLLCCCIASAQLKLGTNPAVINKSSILELESDRQGLLLPRVPDTTVATLATAPDGMIIYLMSDKSLRIRKNGYWIRLADAGELTTGWLLGGNDVATVQSLGTINNRALPIITNNAERIRILGNGLVGINTSTPTSQLHVRTGTSGASGLRLENLTAPDPVTASARAIGVDSSGNVVRAPVPVYFSGTGATAAVGTVSKVWVADVANTSTGVQTINIPGNVAFTNILNIQVTANAKGSNIDVANVPIVTVTNNTLSSITIRVVESNTINTLLISIADGLAAHTATTTRIYIRVEGN